MTSSRHRHTRRDADDGGQQRIKDAKVDRAFTTPRRSIADLEARNAALRKRIGVPTDWDRFKDWYAKTSPIALFVLGLAYVWMDATSYPYPGKRFWLNEQVNNAMTMCVAAAFAVAMLRPMLSWILLTLAACGLFALLFW